MKDIAIATSPPVAWDDVIVSFEDGDVFRESLLDLNVGSIADRLGYLKATLDTKPDVDDDIEFTGTVTFSGDAVFIAPGGGTSEVTGELSVSGTLNAASLSVNGTVLANDGYQEITHILANADETVSADSYQVFRVPVITGNRIYTVSNPTNPGVALKFSKPHVAGFSATIKRADTTTLAILDASERSALTIRSIGSKWVVEDWTAGSVSNIDSDVS